MILLCGPQRSRRPILSGRLPFGGNLSPASKQTLKTNMALVSEQETHAGIGFSTVVTESGPKTMLLSKHTSVANRLAEDHAAEDVKVSRHTKTPA